MSKLSFAIDLWDKLDTVIERAEHGQAGAREVLKFLTTRQEIEAEYAKKLSKLCKDNSYQPKTLYGTMAEGWKSLIELTEQTSILHAQLAQNLHSNIVAPIEGFTKDLMNAHKKTVTDITNLNKERKALHAAMEKSRLAFRKACEESTAADNALTAARAAENTKDKTILSLVTKAEKAQKAMIQSIEEYRLKTAATARFDENYYTKDLPAIMESFERSEIVRTHLLMTNLRKTLEYLQDIPPKEADLIIESKNVVESIDKEDDNQAFIGLNRSSNTPPEMVEYEVYNGDMTFSTESTPRWQNLQHKVDFNSPAAALARSRSRSSSKSIKKKPDNGRERTGWLGKQSNGIRVMYRKRYCVLKNGFFQLFHDPTDPQPSTMLNMMTANVKACADLPRCFQIICADRSYVLECHDVQDCKAWITCLQNATMWMLSSNSSVNVPRDKNAKLKNPLDADLLRASDLESAVQSLREIEGNNVCADCWCTQPEWVSMNLGLFICIECSGHHRHIGAHISKVRSFQLDDWDPMVIEYLKATGNNTVNALYEASAARVRKFKPMDESLFGMRERFITKKYIEKVMFVTKPEDVTPQDLGEQLLAAAGAGNHLEILKLLGWEADVAYSDADGRKALHYAAANGHTLATTCLLLNNAEAEKHVDNYGQTAVHHAATVGQEATLKILLKNGGKPQTVDSAGHTPLELAEMNGHASCVALLNIVIHAADPASAKDEADEVPDNMEEPHTQGYVSDDDGEVGEEDVFKPDEIDESASYNRGGESDDEVESPAPTRTYTAGRPSSITTSFSSPAATPVNSPGTPSGAGRPPPLPPPAGPPPPDSGSSPGGTSGANGPASTSSAPLPPLPSRPPARPPRSPAGGPN